MKLPVAGEKCPHCGKKIPLYNENEYKYGSPIVSCTYCGKKYIDKRYHELAVEGMPHTELNSARYRLFAIICAAVSVLLFAVWFLMYKTGGRVMLEIAVMAPIFALVAVFNLVEFVKVKTGIKEKQLEKYMEESKKRLSDQVYAAELKENGYHIE